MSDFEAFKDLFNESSVSATVLAENLGGVDQRIVDYASTVKNGELTTAGFSQALSQMGIKAKLASVAMTGLKIAGNMFVSWAISKGIEAVAEHIDNMRNATEKATEELENMQSELSSMEDELANLEVKNKEDLTAEEKQRIQYLKERIELEKELVAVQQQETFGTKYDTSNKATWDTESQRYKLEHANDYRSSNKANDFTEAEGLDNTIAKYKEYNDTLQNLDSTTLAYKNTADKMKETEQELIAQKGTLIEDIMFYEDQIQGINEDISNGLQGEDLATAEANKAQWESMLQAAKSYKNYIDNLLATPEDELKSLDEKLSNFTSQELASKFSSSEIALLAEGEIEFDKDATEEDLRKILDEAQQVADENPIVPTIEEPKYSDSSLGALTSVQGLSKGFDQLDEIYADVLDGADFDWSAILNNDDFSNAFGNMENVTDEYKNAYEDFIKTVSNSPDDLGACQEAFNNLATAYLTNSDVLQNLTTNTKDATIAQLEQMGVANAEEIVLDVLAQKERILAVEKEKSAIASQNYAMSTWDEINALLNTEKAGSVAQQAMAQLALEKYKVNGITINTSADIAQIINLANTALAGTEALAQLAKAKSVLSAVESAGSRERAGISESAYLEALDVVEQLNNGTYDFKTQAIDLTNVLVDYGGGLKSTAAAQDKLKNSTNSAKDALNKQKDALESQKQTLEDQKQRLEDLASAITWFYDRRIEKLEEEAEAIEENIQAWEDLASAIQSYLSDYSDSLDIENDALQGQVDDMDSALSAINNAIEIRIQELEKEKEALSGNTEEQEKQLELEQAMLDLEKTRNQRNKKVYSKGQGFVYQADEKAIKDAEDRVANAQAELASAKIDKDIDRLQELKDSWGDVAEAHSNAMSEIAAQNILGDNWKEIALNPSDIDIGNFQNRYTGVQSQITDNEAEKKKTEELIKLWEDASEEYEKNEYKKILISRFGSNYEAEILSGSLDKWNEYVSGYQSAQDKLANVNSQITHLEELKSGWEEAINTYEESQNRARLASFFGSDYEYELLSNSTSWKKKFVNEYAGVCSQIESIENQLKSLTEELANMITDASQQATGALKNISDKMNNLGDNDTKTVSEYVWGNEDERTLALAYERLGYINTCISDGETRLVGTKAKVEDFIKAYEGLRDSGIITEDLKNKTSLLNDEYKIVGDSFSTALGGLNDSIFSVTESTTKIVQDVGTIETEVLELDSALRSTTEAEETVEEEAEDKVTQISNTIDTTIQNLGKIKEAFEQLELDGEKLEAESEEVVSSTNNVVTEVGDNVATTAQKVGEIRIAVTNLLTAIGLLESALSNLQETLGTLNNTDLSLIISTFGFGDDGTSLCGAVWSVINTINNELIGATLPLLNEQKTDAISKEFNGEADSLLFAINEVIDAINDGTDECLVNKINNLTKTIPNINRVEGAFESLYRQVEDAKESVKNLRKEISKLKDKTVTITVEYVTVGSDTKATGTAFTGKGYATGTAPSQGGKAFSSGVWGLPQDEPKSLVGEVGREILLRDGTWRTIDSPQLIDLKKGDIIFNHEQSREILEHGKTSNIKRLSKLGNQKAKSFFKGRAFASGTAPLKPEALEDLYNYAPNSYKEILKVLSDKSSIPDTLGDNKKPVEVSFNGNINLHGVQDVDGLAKAIKNQLPRKMQQELSKRN